MRGIGNKTILFYTFFKLANLLMIIAQIFLLNVFIGYGNPFWGITVIFFDNSLGPLSRNLSAIYGDCVESWSRSEFFTLLFRMSKVRAIFSGSYTHSDLDFFMDYRTKIVFYSVLYSNSR